MLSKIPSGFEMMDLVLILNNRASKALEHHVLRYIVRDFYVFYSKEKWYCGSKKKSAYHRFHFFARPKDAQQVAYRIGINLQCLSPFHEKEDILLAAHTVTKPFPESIRIDEKNVKTEIIKKTIKS